MSRSAALFGRRHNADLARKRRNRPLPFWLEQALLLQLLFELFECELQGAQTRRLEHLDNQLVFAASFVRAYAAARAKPLSILRTESKQSRRIAETHGGQLRAIVLQCEVEVAGRGCLAVGQLAFHPDVDETPLQHVANLEAEFRYRIDLSLKFRVSHAGSIV